MENKDITIVSIFYSEGSKRFLELNYDSVLKRNPQTNWVWVAVDNTMPGMNLNMDLEKFLVVKGVNHETVINSPTYPKEWYPERITGWEHGEGLNSALPHVGTRFLAILDNNSYVVRNNWLNDVMEHMKKNDLGIFGEPFSPSRPGKPRYFPCSNVMVFDLEKIDKKTLDFTPCPWEKENICLPPSAARKMLRFIFPQRWRIGFGREAGYRINARYANSGVKSGYVQPVFRPSRKREIFESIFPENFSFVPKVKDYYTREGFLDAYRKTPLTQAVEEYMWHGKPFGFHIRGLGRLKTPEAREEKFNLIEEVLNKFV